jgi:hypothetical protein
MRRSAQRSLVLALGLGMVLGAPDSAAERVRTGAVGAVAVGPGARQAALHAGVREAVLLVAVAVAREAGARSETREVLRRALGEDLLAYAAQYELVEDRGERPAQLVQDPGVEREYVVLIEAQVERTQIRDALIRAGLLGATSEIDVHSLWITIDGVDDWQTWERLRRALAARGGSVRPVEFSRGVVVADRRGERRADRASAPGAGRLARAGAHWL